jgi:hypothetical protein
LHCRIKESVFFAEENGIAAKFLGARNGCDTLMKKTLLLLVSLALALVIFTGWRQTVPLFGSKPDVQTLRISLLTAVRADNAQEAKRLIQMGADVNSRTSPNGWSVLHYAVRNGDVEIVEALLQAGADANYSGTMEGQTKNIVTLKPLEIAQAAQDLVTQVAPSAMEATLRQAGLDDPALLKSMKEPNAADRYQQIAETLTKFD